MIREAFERIRRSAAPAAPSSWAWAISASAVILLVVGMLQEGRRAWCACGGMAPVTLAVHTEHTSQHVLDPYSLTHVEHGVILYGLTTWLIPAAPAPWRIALTTCVEAGWEMLENTQTVVDRYRKTTVSYGYSGDTIANSLGDVLACVVGFLLAGKLGLKGSLVFMATTELLLLVAIRDNLFLNVLMLLRPIPAIKGWQESVLMDAIRWMKGALAT